MSDPTRLSETDEAVRRLFEANHADRAPDGVRRNVQALVAITAASAGVGALGQLASSSAATGTSSGTWTGFAGTSLGAKVSLLGTSSLLKIVSGLVVMGIAGAGVWVGAETATEEPIVRPVANRNLSALVTASLKLREDSPSPPAVDQDAPLLDVNELPFETDVAEDSATTLRRIVPSSRHVKPETAVASSVPPSPDRVPGLGEELELIARARRQLKVADEQAARATLAEYRRRFPEGKLLPEAQQLERRIERR